MNFYKFQPETVPTLWMLVSKANVGMETHVGLELMGHGLAREIISFVREQLKIYTPDEIQLTLVGHSLGGLIARYAAKLLLNGESQVNINDIVVTPRAYYSISSPHLGARLSSNYPDFKGFKTGVKAFGTKQLCSNMLERTGLQLHLEDDTLMEMALDSGTSF
jgi:hypothetical protein